MCVYFGVSIGGTSCAGCFEAESCCAVIGLAYVKQMSLIDLAFVDRPWVLAIWSTLKDADWLGLLMRDPFLPPRCQDGTVMLTLSNGE